MKRLYPSIFYVLPSSALNIICHSLAQEVEKVAKDLKYDFNGVYKPKNDKHVYGLSYADFVAPLVKAVQELTRKGDKVDELGKENAEIKKQLA